MIFRESAVLEQLAGGINADIRDEIADILIPAFFEKGI